MKKSKEPFTPAERHETVRQGIISAISGRALSAKEISAEVRISEKDAYSHLDHIRKTLNRKESRLVVVPAECRHCGFVFRKRERLSKPGKCPVCRGESISDPLFAIEDAAKPS